MGFFKEQDVASAVEAIKQWMEKYPEAASALKEVWLANYMLAGHKEMARLFVKKGA
jgi:hypothetical protein